MRGDCVRVLLTKNVAVGCHTGSISCFGFHPASSVL